MSVEGDPDPIAVSLLPHQKPWLLVNKVIRIAPGEEILTEMNLASDNIFIVSHFSGKPPLVPGVLLIEFVAQSAHLLSLLSNPQRERPGFGEALPVIPPLLARCKSTFLAPVFAGETVRARVKLEVQVMGASVHHAELFVNQREVCRVEIFGSSKSALVDPLMR